MCIAILNLPGHTIPEETFRQCWKNNPHGGGLAWTEPDEATGIHTVRSFKTLDEDEFYSTYQKVRFYAPLSNLLVHFRITTHGGTNLHNCHPFPVTSGKTPMFLIHNGVIPGYGNRTDTSDTNQFCSDFLSMLPPGWEKCRSTRRLVGRQIGWSKLVLLREDNKYYIVNEFLGHWNHDLGCWFSNHSYKEKVVLPYDGVYRTAQEEYLFTEEMNERYGQAGWRMEPRPVIDRTGQVWDKVKGWIKKEEKPLDIIKLKGGTLTWNEETKQYDSVTSEGKALYLPAEAAAKLNSVMREGGRSYSQEIKNLSAVLGGNCPTCEAEIGMNSVTYKSDSDAYHCLDCDANLTLASAVTLDEVMSSVNKVNIKAL